MFDLARKYLVGKEKQACGRVKKKVSELGDQVPLSSTEIIFHNYKTKTGLNRVLTECSPIGQQFGEAIKPQVSACLCFPINEIINEGHYTCL